MTSTPAPARPQGALLVGSIPLPDGESVFRAAAGALGDRLKRIPDGETGERWHWIGFQPGRLAPAAGLERVGDQPYGPRGLDLRGLRIADGVDAATIELPALGYAEAAIDAWAVFRRLQAEGVIPAGTRFQVSLPTPLATIGAFIAAEDQAAFEPVYEAAIRGELEAILAVVPHDRLAIQWDNAVEFGLIEAAKREDKSLGGMPFGAWFDDVWGGILERTARAAAWVPAEVELGYHLCYGDVAEEHFVQPADAADLVRFTNGVLQAAGRPVQWVHLPVPIDRVDDAYFAPLADLALPEGTELYLGLVHREDGVPGAEARIAAAARHAPAFGVATECGIGRSPAETLPAILATHAAIADAWDPALAG